MIMLKFIFRAQGLCRIDLLTGEYAEWYSVYFSEADCKGEKVFNGIFFG